MSFLTIRGMKKGLCLGLAILSMVVITVRPTTAAVISVRGYV